MPDHYEAMRENHQKYHSSFPASLQGERAHADLSVVLGYAPQPPTGQTCDAEDIDMEDASNVPDATTARTVPPPLLTAAALPETAQASILALSPPHRQTVPGAAREGLLRMGLMALER